MIILGSAFPAIEIIDQSEEYMKNFYDESYEVSNVNMFDCLLWLSHSDKEKLQILDDDLNNYFK